jgi:hypothetical protein
MRKIAHSGHPGLRRRKLGCRGITREKRFFSAEILKNHLRFARSECFMYICRSFENFNKIASQTEHAFLDI